MTKERFKELFNSTRIERREGGDNVYKGLEIIKNNVPENTVIVCAAEHDVIMSVDIDILLPHISEDDVIRLRQLNWMIDYEHGCLSTFV